MKKMISIFLCLLLLISSGAVVFAGGEMAASGGFENESQQLKMSLSDESQIISKISNDDMVTPNGNAALYWTWKKSSESVDKTSASLIKASADVTGPGSITATFSKSVTESFSITLNSNQKSLIKGSVTASIGSTLSNSLGYKLDVASGKKGYLAYQPYLVVVKGTMKQYNSLYPDVVLSTVNPVAKYPKKLTNGFLDGHYFIKYI